MLQRFIFRFISITGCLVVIFSCIHYLMRSTTVSMVTLIPIIFGVMLPMVLQYVIPVAASASVYMVIGTLAQKQELLLLYFMRRSQYLCMVALFVFTTLVSIGYAYLLFFWVPQSYIRGKQALIEVAQQQFLDYEANCLHQPIPGINLIFKKKMRLTDANVQLDLLFLSYKTHKECYMFTAEQGVLSGQLLFLIKGSLLYQIGRERYYSRFGQTSIDIARLIRSDEQNTPVVLTSLKCATWSQLLERAVYPSREWLETHKRYGYIVWQWLSPFVVFLVIFFLPRRKNVIFEAFLISAALFLAMYLGGTVGQIIGGYKGITCFYLPPILLTLWCMYLYRFHS